MSVLKLLNMVSQLFLEHKYAVLKENYNIQYFLSITLFYAD